MNGAELHGSTILSVRKGDRVVIACDGNDTVGLGF